MQRLRHLLRQRSARRADGAFVVEGTRVLEVALASGAALEAAYYAPAALEAETTRALLGALREAGVRCFGLARGVMERVADTATPQAICAVAHVVDVELALATAAETVLVCCDVRDPGNLGSTLRSADAAGIGAVICAGGTVDLYNPKTVRASAGALFRVCVATVEDTTSVFAALRSGGHRLIGAAGAGRDYAEVGLEGRVAIVVGNEANGLAPAQLAAMDELCAVPMRAGAESLNVAMAATVLCFELARRRRSARA